MTIKPNEINGTIAERICGLRHFADGVYNVGRDWGGQCPDFLGDPAARKEMVTAMSKSGFACERTVNAINPASGVGQTFTCRFARPYRSGEATHPDEGFACCLAALKALGIDVVANGA